MNMIERAIRSARLKFYVRAEAMAGCDAFLAYVRAHRLDILAIGWHVGVTAVLPIEASSTWPNCRRCVPWWSAPRSSRVSCWPRGPGSRRKRRSAVPAASAASSAAASHEERELRIVPPPIIAQYPPTSATTASSPAGTGR